MKAIVLAYHSIGCIGIDKLIEAGFDIQAVFTHPDDPNENTWFDSVAERAALHDLPVFAPENINHPLWVEKISAMQPDIIFSFYYRNMVGREVLEIPAQGCLNLHGSLLPAYRGRCPVNWVLVHGEDKSGVTLHYMTPQPDDGDIVGQEVVGINRDDTALTLHRKIAEASGKLLQKVLPGILDGSAVRIPQDNSLATYFGGRKPTDGEIDWTKSAEEIRNLVRAVTKPYPGAFSFLGTRKAVFWQVETSTVNQAAKPGLVISDAPFIVACGDGAVEIKSGQVGDNGLMLSGRHLVSAMSLVKGMHLGPDVKKKLAARRKKSVLILGADGFIGSHLSEYLLDTGRYEVHGMDLGSSYIKHLLGHPNFHFFEGDISIQREWIEYHVRKCDIILPLVAIATPAEYTKNPLRVFELDFEENLRIVRYCAKYGKRVLFPSTSEVYGMCQDTNFDEDNSQLVLGPIRKQRWIYSCSKQLMDRVIWAYGATKGLDFTLFRPFNWVGSRLDSLASARIGSSRAITQLILNLAEGTPIQLVDGGYQKRCFTDVKDGIDCLYRIIENKNNVCDSGIFNIGNPYNEASIRSLAEILVDKFQKHPLADKFPPFAGMREVESRTFYGKGYEDVNFRKPSIKKAERLLGWKPSVSLEQSVEETLDFFLKQAVDTGEFEISHKDDF
ncbi:MAG: bifunctional UDP-4-amino-4-deoxy-L-arabinose formyltransferase/UDP-glucuronic acid oxidase ArnA [Proteobacteria bacterium]|nr:bifunctional UDP-4-amino-4-deoxy-L-arabinose formyltransferase/UDP-glucuronic acid oxidase ArnA [Pseudomonadota bacterium]MBU1417024.1 bifunctional UDP-4-amino-4-deoxy-L-arabinose formyltransferase/UDP-glucuronic acid oxidase ArnA [Pseudomonadota bacterium]MBU1453720.1 bifunctional UDP-4-amino-4-deoxy-L-arabinose formyltransferase/UDP-glucuronic acid oxidase ArnA [Pseudomonadota bacterium]